MSAKVELTGGNFQDSEGNLLANGTLVMRLSQDANIPGTAQVCAGIDITIKLNSSGSVDTSTPQLVWANDQMSPVNTFYRVTGFKSNGQPAWGPNNQQVTGSGGTFDVGTWVPNQVISWTPSTSAIQLETNGTLNTNQNKLNLVQSTGMTITADGSGDVTFAASGGSGPALQVDGTPNGSQTLLNLSDQMASGSYIDYGNGTVLYADGDSMPTNFYAQLTSGASPTAPNPFRVGITSATLTSNVVTCVSIPSERGSWNLDLGANSGVYLSGFTGSYSFLNGQLVTLTSADMIAGSLVFPFTHANVALASGLTAAACVTYTATVSYAGVTFSNASPPVASPATAPTNTGALWVQPSADFSTYQVKSTNASDGNWVNGLLTPLYF